MHQRLPLGCITLLMVVDEGMKGIQLCLSLKRNQNSTVNTGHIKSDSGLYFGLAMSYIIQVYARVEGKPIKMLEYGT